MRNIPAVPRVLTSLFTNRPPAWPSSGHCPHALSQPASKTARALPGREGPQFPWRYHLAVVSVFPFFFLFNFFCCHCFNPDGTSGYKFHMFPVEMFSWRGKSLGRASPRRASVGPPRDLLKCRAGGRGTDSGWVPKRLFSNERPEVAVSPLVGERPFITQTLWFLLPTFISEYLLSFLTEFRLVKVKK